EIMRDEYHTLDHLSARQFNKLAREAYAALPELRALKQRLDREHAEQEARAKTDPQAMAWRLASAAHNYLKELEDRRVAKSSYAALDAATRALIRDFDKDWPTRVEVLAKAADAYLRAEKVHECDDLTGLRAALKTWQTRTSSAHEVSVEPSSPDAVAHRA